MATDSLSYSGINRAVSDFSGAKFCEELINLRPTTDGLVPVKPFTTKYADTVYCHIFVHHTTSGDNYIGIRKNASTLKVSAELIGASPAYTFFEKSFSGGGYPSSEARVDAMNKFADALSFAAAGNVALFSAYEKTYSVYGNWAFMWKNSAYDEMEAGVPELTVTTVDGGNVVKASQEIKEINNSTNEQDVLNSVETAVSAVQEINPELCLGTIIIATAFKTTDGETLMTGNWMIYDPLQTIGTTSPPYEDATTLDSGVANLYQDFFSEHDLHGYRITPTIPAGYGTFPISRLDFYGTNVKLQIGALSSTPGATNYWDADSSIIKSVEVYASRPVLYFNPESAYEGFRKYHDIGLDDTYLTILLSQRMYEDMDIGGQLLYHQASVTMESLIRGQQEVTLKFGGNAQVTNGTLRVDAGDVTRYGRLLSYNSRFHYYDSVARTVVPPPSFSGLIQHAFSSTYTYILARYSDGKSKKLLYLGRISGGYDSANLTMIPSLNVTEVILYSKFTRNGAATYRDSVCRLSHSETYNYSYGDLGDWQSTDGSGTKSEYEDAIPSDSSKPDNVVYSAETAAINVTEQYNPFVFRVEHSYLAPGNIVDLVPQNFVVTDATYGREPLDVFTTNGVYALIQGSGDVLYAWFDSIDPMVAYGRAVPTEMGIFFLSGGCLYLCAGHRVTLVSDALSRGPHKYIRECLEYKKISGTETPNTSITPEYDVAPYLSKIEFEKFTGGDPSQGIGRGTLSYNRFRQEVYVSNASYSYSYVLSLKYRQWFKVSFRIWQDEQGAPIANLPSSTAGRMNVVDLSSESAGSVLAHLQSRPFSMGYQYCHMHRLISQIRATLKQADSHLAILALYGSDNLQEWKLLAYAKRQGTSPKTVLSQIRTTTAARSWRYYTICIGGQIPTDADFGPFLVDYDAVVRRLG